MNFYETINVLWALVRSHKSLQTKLNGTAHTNRRRHIIRRTPSHHVDKCSAHHVHSVCSWYVDETEQVLSCTIIFSCCELQYQKVTENGTDLNITTWFDNYILRTTLAMLIRSTLAILTVRQMLWYIAANQISFAWKIKMKSKTGYCGEFHYMLFL